MGFANSKVGNSKFIVDNENFRINKVVLDSGQTYIFKFDKKNERMTMLKINENSKNTFKSSNNYSSSKEKVLFDLQDKKSNNTQLRSFYNENTKSFGDASYTTITYMAGPGDDRYNKEYDFTNGNQYLETPELNNHNNTSVANLIIDKFDNDLAYYMSNGKDAEDGIAESFATLGYSSSDTDEMMYGLFSLIVSEDGLSLSNLTDIALGFLKTAVGFTGAFLIADVATFTANTVNVNTTFDRIDELLDTL
jgi:hypothetical protein